MLLLNILKRKSQKHILLILNQYLNRPRNYLKSVILKIHLKTQPVEFLDVFLKSLTLSSFLVYLSIGLELKEYVFVIFFLGCSIITHIISGKKFRKYFN